MSRFLKNTIFLFFLLNLNLIIAQEQKDIVVTLYRTSENSLNNDGELLYSQKRIQQIFNKENFLKCIKKASKNIRRNEQDKVAYYYLALSTYKIYEEKLDPILFDRTLKFLKASNFNEDTDIRKFHSENKKLIESIHQEAIALSENEDQLNRHKILRRLQYVAELYQDSTDLFKQILGLDDKEIFQAKINDESKIEDDVDFHRLLLD